MHIVLRQCANLSHYLQYNLEVATISNEQRMCMRRPELEEFQRELTRKTDFDDYGKLSIFFISSLNITCF